MWQSKILRWGAHFDWNMVDSPPQTTSGDESGTKVRFLSTETDCLSGQ